MRFARDVEMRTLLVALALAPPRALAVACAPTIDVHTIVFPATDVTRYQTFSFGAAESTPSEYQASPRSAEVQRRVRLLIAGILQERGYVRRPDGEGTWSCRSRPVDANA
jgi:hypothetical protein